MSQPLGFTPRVTTLSQSYVPKTGVKPSTQKEGPTCSGSPRFRASREKVRRLTGGAEAAGEKAAGGRGEVSDLGTEFVSAGLLRT